MGNDLKNCPFCGGEANLFSKFKVNGDALDEYASNGYSVRCECKVCGAEGKEFISLENPANVEWNNMACKDAVRAWNMRYEKNKSDISDVALKMAIAYAQIEYEKKSKSGNTPLGYEKMSDFLETVADFYRGYNNFCIEETLSSMIEEENDE
ncbi:MAG: Lar family restriction alleviation protein [Oscillospiraceae bacterium]|nr:Lar family restriction alleviation protein [Oscillospiraceae bacterium]